MEIKGNHPRTKETLLTPDLKTLTSEAKADFKRQRENIPEKEAFRVVAPDNAQTLGEVLFILIKSRAPSLAALT